MRRPKTRGARLARAWLAAPLAAALVTTLALGGCAGFTIPAVQPQQAQRPAQTQTQSSQSSSQLPPQSLQTTRPASEVTLQALTVLNELKEELKQLRNAVEEMQFDTETATRRQQNLFQDLDRRLLSLERAQRLLQLPNPAGNLGALNPATPPAALGGAIPGTISGTTGDTTGDTTGGDIALVVSAPVSALGGTTSPAAPIVVPSASVQTPTDATETLAADSTDADAATDEPDAEPTTIAAVTAPPKAVTLQEQQQYDRAFNLLKLSQYEDAIAQFQQLAGDWPDGALADDAHYWIAEARYVNREFEAALRGFRTVLARYPGSERAPEALLKTGYIQYDIGAYAQAAEIFREVLLRFPTHLVAVSAQTRLRRIEHTIQ
ncbi:MAG: tol-pal system protein YbgF [bacterium]